jgi:Protein of unknown function (DUF3710)
MSDRARDGSELTERRPSVPGESVGDGPGAARGPYDSGDPRPADQDGTLDFGPLRFRIPDEARLRAENTAGTVARTVHLLVPTGHVDLSVLAAPRSSPLWPEIAEEVATVQGNSGAQVRSEPGEWGPEVLAVSDDELSWFIGVDGPRWMLYGVATGPAAGSAELGATLREIIRGSVVRRGVEPLPVKTPLALTPPAQRRQAAEETGEHPGRQSPSEPVWFRLGPTPANAAVTPAPRLAPEPVRPVAPIGGAQAQKASRRGLSEPDRAGRWGLPTGVTVGAAGLILLVGVASALVIERNGEQAAPTPPAALPDPANALTNPATALTNPPPDPATALSDPPPGPAIAAPGTGIPALIPRRRAPTLTAPAASDPHSMFATPRTPGARLLERSRGARAQEVEGAAPRPERPSTDSEADSEDRATRSTDSPDSDAEQTSDPGLLGELTGALDQGWLGLG